MAASQGHASPAGSACPTSDIMAEIAGHRSSMEGARDVTSFAACGVPPSGLGGMWSANDSELLCSATQCDVEEALNAAQHELVQKSEQHRRAAKSKQRRAEIADRRA